MPISENYHSSQSTDQPAKKSKSELLTVQFHSWLNQKTKKNKNPTSVFTQKNPNFPFLFHDSQQPKSQKSQIKKKKKTWTFSIITIHWAKPRSQKGKKCTDPSQNQSVYININTVTLIQISQKNKYKTKLEKKKRGFSQCTNFGSLMIADCVRFKSQETIFGWERVCVKFESKFIGFYLCLY